MKKIITLLCFVLMVIPVFAVNTPTADALDESATQTVTFTIGDDLYTYNVGFSTKNDGNAVTTMNNTVLALSADDKTVATNADSDLYIWWDILTASPFHVTLTIDDALTATSGDSSPTINYTVTGALTQTAKPEGQDDATKIDLSTKTGDGLTNTVDFIDFEGSEGVASSFKGYQKLTIATIAGELQNKPEGTYDSTLTLTVAAN